MAAEEKQTEGAQLGTQIAEAIKALVPKKKVSVGELVPKTKFNPTGKKNRKLTRPTFINGVPVDINTAFDEELALYGKLKTGKYLGGLLRVQEVDKGVQGTELHLFVNHGDVTARMAFRDYGKDWRTQLKAALDEQNANVQK